MALHRTVVVKAFLCILSITFREASSRRIWDTLAEGVVERNLREAPTFSYDNDSKQLHRESREKINDVKNDDSSTAPVDDDPFEVSLKPIGNGETIHNLENISHNEKPKKTLLTEAMASSGSSNILHTDIQKTPHIHEHLNKLARIPLGNPFLHGIEKDHEVANHAPDITSVFGNHMKDTRNEKRRHLILHFGNIFLKSLSNLLSGTHSLIERALKRKP